MTRTENKIIKTERDHWQWNFACVDKGNLILPLDVLRTKMLIISWVQETFRITSAHFKTSVESPSFKALICFYFSAAVVVIKHQVQVEWSEVWLDIKTQRFPAFLWRFMDNWFNVSLSSLTKVCFDFKIIFGSLIRVIFKDPRSK